MEKGNFNFVKFYTYGSDGLSSIRFNSHRELNQIGIRSAPPGQILSLLVPIFRLIVKNSGCYPKETKISKE